MSAITHKIWLEVQVARIYIVSRSFIMNNCTRAYKSGIAFEWHHIASWSLMTNYDDWQPVIILVSSVYLLIKCFL